MNRVLIIDDEPQIRKFLNISLTSQGYDVIEAKDGRSGLALLALESPDLAVLDLGLPDMDGQQVLRELRQFSSCPVIVLSVRSGEQDKVQALDAGANDFVVKPFGIKELLARIRAMLRLFSDTTHSDPVFEDGRLRVDLSNRRLSIQGQPVHLSRKEFELLRLLVNHRGRLLTQQHLLREIWGASHIDNTHYLRVLVGKLRTKLGDDPADPKYIETEPGVGYRFVDREPQ